MGHRDDALAFGDGSRSALFVRALVVASAAYVTVGYLWVIAGAGVTSGRLALAVVSLAFAWGGVAGTLLERPAYPLVGALALFLLGFWQAVLWAFMLPAALGLAIGAVVTAHAF